MTTHRLRIRYAKEGQLRLISHRDLVRAFERLFRRAAVPLAMTQGFHPRPQLTCPDALALGVEGKDEVIDVVLTEPLDTDDLHRRLTDLAPDGLVIRKVQKLGPADRKAQVQRVGYEIRLPDNIASASLQHAVDQLRNATGLTVKRKDKQVEVDLRDTLEVLQLDAGLLKMNLRTVGQGQLQPRDILATLGLQDVLREGAILTRTYVELKN